MESRRPKISVSDAIDDNGIWRTRGAGDGQGKGGESVRIVPVDIKRVVAVCPAANGNIALARPIEQRQRRSGLRNPAQPTHARPMCVRRAGSALAKPGLEARVNIQGRGRTGRANDAQWFPQKALIDHPKRHCLGAHRLLRQAVPQRGLAGRSAAQLLGPGDLLAHQGIGLDEPLIVSVDGPAIQGRQALERVGIGDRGIDPILRRHVAEGHTDGRKRWNECVRRDCGA